MLNGHHFRELNTSSSSARVSSRNCKKRSPFLVDLVAENERIEEKNKLLRFQRFKNQKILARQREKVKKEVIIQSLNKDNGIDFSRREKRKKFEEEKRLKAMIQIEKVTEHSKANRIKAQQANIKRWEEKRRNRRRLNKELIDEKITAKKNILRLKHKIQDNPGNTFSSHSY